jgi:hypothetical protein
MPSGIVDFFFFFFSGGKPISENLDSARLSCVHISPENRFKYVWKLLKPDQVSILCINNPIFIVADNIWHPALMF